jgi:membrane protein required for colicin V production
VRDASIEPMDHLSLTAFDVAVLLVVGVSVIVSLMRGAAREALAIATWVGAGAVAWYGFGYLRELARKTIESPWLADVAAFCVAFIVPLLAFKLAAAMLADRLPGGRIALVDRAAGAAFGAARGAVIVCAVYLGLSMVLTPKEQPAWIRNSLVLPYVRDGAGLLQRWVPEKFARSGKAAADMALQQGDQLGRSARELAGK